MNLLEATLTLINQSHLSVEDIATGSGVHPRWLYYLKQGRFKNPGIRKIQSIHDFLNRKLLETQIELTDKTQR